jgi:hypothetical protein
MHRFKKILNTIKYSYHYLWACYYFSDYKPQPITIRGIINWLNQFDEKDRKIILALLHKVTYYSEKETESIIVDLNEQLLERLEKADIPLKKVIYVQIHDPGSSSPVMLSIVRDRGRIERKGCYFIDSKNVREILETTTKLEQGAIIYVDDFAASGDQFAEAREFLAQHIIGNFSEFFLLPVICEEAHSKLSRLGVEPITRTIHSKADRPLHPHSSLLDKASKDRLIDICRQIDKRGGLGYKELATMVVFYRNSPNSLPVILRGCVKQNPWRGILPRTTDLP